jgi:PhnB protein
MASANVYLNFLGYTEKAFDFYKSVFGGEYAMLMRFKDTSEAGKMPEADQDKIMHIALPIGDSMLMGTDALESMGQTLTMGNNFSISVSTDSREDADRFFAGISAGGTVVMPLENTFWGSYFGMCTDKFEVQWMISYDKK